MSTKFDNKISKMINKLEINPTDGLWNKIEAELPEKNSKKAFIIPFFGSKIIKQAMAASVIFLLGGFTSYFLLNDRDNGLSVKTNVNKNNTTNILTKDNQNTKKVITSDNQKKNLTTFLNKEEENINTIPSKTLASNTAIKNSTKVISNYNNTLYSNNKNYTASPPTDYNLSASKNNTSVNDYQWVFDESTNAYQVVLRKENNAKKSSNVLIVNNIVEEEKSNDAILMSIEENKKEEDEIPEILKINEEEKNLGTFKSKVTKINYKGLWLGPMAGYESIFVDNEHYPGGIFGVDVGYDFGGAFGLQSGIHYAIHSKIFQEKNMDGITVDYKSEFNSLHIPLIGRLKFTKLTDKYSKPLSLNLLAGIDYAFVNTKDIHQLGFVLGTEYDVFTQADLMFTIGVRGGAYNNLNKNSIEIPEKLNNFNYSLSAYIAVRFIDWAKRD